MNSHGFQENAILLRVAVCITTQLAVQWDIAEQLNVGTTAIAFTSVQPELCKEDKISRRFFMIY